MRNKILFSVAAINLLASVQILAAQNGENAAGKETLQAVEVTSEQRRDDVKYNAKELVKSTTRLDLTSRQTPQSLTVITEARLKDQNINDYQCFCEISRASRLASGMSAYILRLEALR